MPSPSFPHGVIFNIQRFSIHDGPGIRTTVFLKGCNLRCVWCHNPESHHMQPEVEFFPEKCIACGGCAEVCPQGAHSLNGSQHIYDREVCRACGLCVQECFTGALALSGQDRTVEQVLVEIVKDADYFQTSGGGVTFSGGEPLLQPEFLLELLQACRQQGLHCAVDTAGAVPWDRFESILPVTDLFLFDVKAFSEETHRRITGLSNRLILENLRKLAAAGKDIWVRIPLAAGVNDSAQEIGAIAGLLAPLKAVRRVDILPYHTLGSEKYASLGLPYPAQGYTPPKAEKMQAVLEQFQAKGIQASWME